MASENLAFDDQACTVWPTTMDGPGQCYELPSTLTESEKIAYRRMASDYLWAMTGRRFGPQCPITVRPCRKSCADSYDIFASRFFQGTAYSTGPYIPYMRDGQMYNAVICGCRDECSCGREVCEVELPGPIYDFVEVNVGGTVVDQGLYGSRDGRFLIRTRNDPDDTECWPTCQDLNKSYGTSDTFSVTYRVGLQIPQSGVFAVSALAHHLAQGCGGGCGCGVGSRTNLSRLSRQGVDLEFADAQQVFTDGRTGIEIVDFFIQAMASPVGLRSPLRVLSPDRKLPRIYRGM